MCRSTEAAVCSPSVSSKIAARSVPLTVVASAIVLADPITNDLCDLTRILARDAARRGHPIVVAHAATHRAARRASRDTFAPRTRRPRGGGRDGCGRVSTSSSAAARTTRARHERSAERLARDRPECGRSQNARRRRILDSRQPAGTRIQHRDRVAAHLVETDRLLHELRERRELGSASGVPAPRRWPPACCRRARRSTDA